MCPRTAVTILVLAAAGCGARTEPWADGDGGGASSGDAAADRCAPIFEDCDGSAADCEEAFHRGCACGDPPGYIVAGPEVTVRGLYNYRVRWTGERFVVPINEGEPPSVEVFDATGGRRLRSFPGYLRAIDGPTLYVGDNDPYGEAWMQAFDAATGEPVGPGRTIPLGGLTPLGGGDLAGQRQTDRGIVPWREHHVYSGLVRADGAGVAWTAVLPDLEWATAEESSWNGTHVVSVHGADRLFLYDPYANEVAGPIRYRSPDRDAYSVGDPDPILRTESGWLAIWSEMTRDLRNGDLVTVALTAGGEPRGPVTRWHDHESRMTYRLGRLIAQRPNGEVAVIYTRTLADRVERVMLRLDEDGRVLGHLGTPRSVEGRDFNGLRSFLWAGYSYAFAENAYHGDYHRDYAGLRLQRVCP